MEPISVIRRQPSMLSMIVWVLFCLIMWGWAIILPILVVLGVIQMLFHPPFMDVELGATPEEQMRNLGSAAVMGAIGLAFVVLRLRGHVHFGDRD
jgi:hypothetical protein